MRSHQPKLAANNRLRGGIQLQFALVVVATLVSVTFTQAGRATESTTGILFFVTCLDDHDDGACTGADCTLREAIKAANSNPGNDDGIEFAVTGVLTRALTEITYPHQCRTNPEDREYHH